jgi:quercetin dioxygenase-like cupin family protein
MKGKEIVIDPGKSEWEEISLSGMKIKYLYKNEETGASIALVDFKKGFGMPEPHVHASNQFMYVLKGKFSYPGIEVNEGMLYINPKDNTHGPSKALEDTLVLEIYDGPHYYPDKRPY